jgi:type I restriction enzyme S subunit
MNQRLPHDVRSSQESANIPENWDEEKLSDLGTLKNGINKGADSFGHGFPFVNLMDIFGVSRIINTRTLGLIHSSHAERKAYDLQKGDVLFVRSSVKPSGVGLATLIVNSLPNTVFSGFLLRFRSNNRIINSLKPHLFSESNFRNRVMSASTVSANTNINQRSLGSIYVRFPGSKKEQEAVAQALDDADKLITTLERMIAKKQAIKQGMMQQLLTGKTRLPGFSDPWHAATIGDLAQIVSGGTPSSSVPAYWNGGVAWCTPTDITREPGRFLRRTERTISSEGLEQSSAQLLPAGSLLLCTRATIGEVKIATLPVSTNQGFKSLVPRPQVSGIYLYYKILTLKEDLVAKGTGSTFLEVSKRDVSSLTFHVPRFEEQVAIGYALSDSDDEIEMLKKRLVKARSIKSGMMQQLLTGRTRLLSVKAPS